MATQMCSANRWMARQRSERRSGPRGDGLRVRPGSGEGVVPDLPAGVLAGLQLVVSDVQACTGRASPATRRWGVALKHMGGPDRMGEGRQVDVRTHHDTVGWRARVGRRGSDGIGFATAQLCHRRGARVSILGRRTKQLDVARRQVPQLETTCGDVTDVRSLAEAVDRLTAVNGDCDVVVACAGGAIPGYVERLEVDTFRQQMELNYLGTVNTVQAVLPRMLARGRGHLVLVSSLAGLIGVFGYGAYTPAKFAVRGLGLTLDAELRHRGISVSIVYPPDTRTTGFEQENRTKPPETVRLSASVPPISAASVAAAMVRGIERDRLTITADRQTAVIGRLADLHGPLVRAVMRRALRD